MSDHPAASTLPPAASVSSILRLAVPSSAVFLLATVIQVFLIRFAAGLGPDAVAAVSTGARLYNVFLAAAAGVNAGALALIANAWGAGRRSEANRLLSLSVALGSAVGGALMLATWAGAPALVSIFDLDPGAHRESVGYVRWLALFYVPMACYFVLVSGLRAAGDVRTPVVFAVIGNLLSIALAWHFTNAGIFGAAPNVHSIAIGLGLGNLVATAMALALWWQRRLLLVPEPPDGRIGLRLRALWQVGYPAALEQGLLQIGVIAFLWVVAHYGTAAYTAYGVGITLLSLAMVVGFGFSIAVSVLVGQQIGAGAPQHARAVAQRALVVTLAVLSLPALGIAINARSVALWLTGDAEIAAHTVQVIYAFSAAMPMLAVEFCLGGALRGAGDTRFPMINVIVGLIVVRFGLALLFLHWHLAVGWIYATLIADFAVKNVLLIWRFRSNRWMKLLPSHKQTQV